MKTVAVKLPDALIQLLDQLVEEGKYANRSMLIRYALIDLLRKEGKI